MPDQHDMADASPADGFGFTLAPRQGLRPLGFQGRLLAAARLAEPGLPVTSAIHLHEVLGGGYVAAIRHETCPPLPPEARCYALRADGADGLLGFLYAHDPLRDLPADALLETAAAPLQAGGLTAAAALAPRLRGAWQGLIAACFGSPGGASPAAADPASSTDDDTPGDAS